MSALSRFFLDLVALLIVLIGCPLNVLAEPIYSHDSCNSTAIGALGTTVAGTWSFASSFFKPYLLTDQQKPTYLIAGITTSAPGVFTVLSEHRDQLVVYAMSVDNITTDSGCPSPFVPSSYHYSNVSSSSSSFVPITLPPSDGDLFVVVVASLYVVDAGGAELSWLQWPTLPFSVCLSNATVACNVPQCEPTCREDRWCGVRHLDNTTLTASCIVDGVWDGPGWDGGLNSASLTSLSMLCVVAVSLIIIVTN